MGCKLGFDNQDDDSPRTLSLPSETLYNAVFELRERLRRDARTETGRFEGVEIVMNVPINRPFEIRAVECKGWYHGEGSGSVLQMACSNCKYRTR